MGEKRTGFHYAWIVLGVCFVDLFINYSARLGYGVVLPEMLRDLSLSRTSGGSIYNAYLFTYIALTPVTGVLTDRLGARRVIAVCALFLGAGMMLMGSVDSLPLACLFFALVGLGATGMWTPVITVVQRWFAPTRRGLALGILSTGYGLGFATMGAAFPYIVESFNWRYAWYFLGAGALIMVAGNGLMLRSDPESSGYRPWGDKTRPVTAPATAPRETGGSPIGAVFRQRTFWIIGASYFCISYSLYGITTFMVDYARDQVGLPLEQASFLATIHGVCQVVGVLTILPLSDVLGRKRTVLLSNLFITLALTGILLFGDTRFTLYGLVGLLAAFYGVTFPLYGACAGDYFPRKVMGTVIGAWTPFYGLGAIMVHWISGYLRDTTGDYTAAFAIGAVFAGAGFLLFFLVRKENRV